MSDFKSEVKQICAPQQAVYDKLSDLNNLSVLKERLAEPDVKEKLASQLGEDKVEQFLGQMENLTFDHDSITIGGSPVGNVCLKVVEREEPKCIKFEGQGTPVALNLWIQIVTNGDTASAIRVTIRAEVNFFMKQIVSKPLQQAADRIAEMLAHIPY